MTKTKKNPERITVNTQGVRIRTPKHELNLSQWRQKKALLFRNSQNKISTPPTQKDLDKLEDAIFNHGAPYRTQFLEICNPSKELIPVNFVDYLSNIPSKRRALLYCWQLKKWRPDKTGNRVLDGSANPYIKQC